MTEGPVTFRIEGRGLEKVEATLLAGEIILAVAPYYDPDTAGTYAGLTPKAAREFGEWLIAASRVSEDLEARRL